MKVQAPKAACRTRPRRVDLDRGEEGWMHSLLAALPDDEYADATSAHYSEVLAQAMADGKILKEEAKELAHVAADDGLRADQVKQIHATFLEGMRNAAFADQIISRDEFNLLQRAARTLGLPDFFEDLRLTPRAASGAQGAPTTSSIRKVRCGLCGEVGHNRRSCSTFTE